MTIERRPRAVLFAVAAGPRLGFGHLVRCGVLADALGVPRRAVLRGGAKTIRAAARLGWRTIPRASVRLRAGAFDVVVIDDPLRTRSQQWVRRARRAGVPVVAISDLGLNRPVGADLTVDGAIALTGAAARAHLQGPAFAILNLPTRRSASARRDRNLVVIALGGGVHVRVAGARIARQVIARVPAARVVLASGFTPGRRPALPANCRWGASAELGDLMRTAAVAVVAGGLTLYESCAQATPTVALAVAPAQRMAIAALAARRAVLDAGAVYTPRSGERAGALAATLLTRPRAAARLARRAGTLVDGQGAMRVAAAVRSLPGRLAINRRSGGTRAA